MAPFVNIYTKTYLFYHSRRDQLKVVIAFYGIGGIHEFAAPAAICHMRA